MKMELQKRIEDLEVKSVAFEKRLKELSVCQRDLLSCRAELAECRTELFDCKEELTTSREDLTSCRQQLDENKETFKEMEKKLEENQSRIRELEMHPKAQGKWMVHQKLKFHDRRMDSLQKEMDSVMEKTERLNKLQHLFKISILNLQRPPQDSLHASNTGLAVVALPKAWKTGVMSNCLIAVLYHPGLTPNLSTFEGSMSPAHPSTVTQWIL